MASLRRYVGCFMDVAHPLNNEFRSRIEQAVLDTYEAEIVSGGSGEESSGGFASPGDEPDEE